MWRRIGYRVIQFWHTATAPVRTIDRVYAMAHLQTAALRHLFVQMSPAEQQHGITCARACARADAPEPASDDLLVAALLHDVGKIFAPPALWERVWVVLVEHYAPALARRLSAGELHGPGVFWRRAFVTRRLHPQWGAELAAAAGATPRVVALIAAHHSPAAGDAELAALQAVDEA